VAGALRPGGLLLDILPDPGDPAVEALTASGPVSIGRVDESNRSARVRHARAALAGLVEAGWFAPERALVFEFASYADTVEDWLAHRTEKGSTSVVSQALLDRARALLAAGAARLCLREQVTATRYRRRPERSEG
jgi:hypothetical protein